MRASMVNFSRSASVLSAFGALLAFAALAYSAYSLALLEQQKAVAASQVADLSAQASRAQIEIQRQKEEVERYRQEARNARQAVAASRAAINAFHAGRLSEAVALYDEALNADPGNAYLQNLRAYSLFRLGRVSDAIEGEQKSIAADPNYAWGYFDLARFLCAAGPARMSEARAAAKRAIELRGDLAEIMRRDGEFQRVCRGQLP